MIVGERIRARRLEMGLSVRELARRMGYADHSTLSRIERGEVELVQSRIVQFARELDTTPRHLMGWDVPADEAGTLAAKVLKDPDIYHTVKKLLALSKSDQYTARMVIDSLYEKNKKED